MVVRRLIFAHDTSHWVHLCPNLLPRKLGTCSLVGCLKKVNRANSLGINEESVAQLAVFKGTEAVLEKC